MQKQMLNELQEERIAHTTIQQEDGTEWLLEYYLQTRHRPEESTIYGIRVDKSTLDGVLIDREGTFVSECRDSVLAMVTAFAKGTVPPSVLYEMVDDWDFCLG